MQSQADIHTEDFFQHLEFQFPFRKYQSMVLGIFDEIKLKQNKFHIVAPPGSGKTILGVEIIRQINKPAVIFSPTTTIQEQWKEKFLMFSRPENSHLIDKLVSSSAKNLKLVNTLTYQVLSTSSENKDFLRELAQKHWLSDLVKNSNLEEAQAKERISALQQNNPDNFAKEISKYQLKAREELLTNPDFNVRDLLHTNAKKLIESFVKNDTKVIVLDECHHLLDYWAVIIKELIRSLNNPFIVGLTATPPLSAGEGELENYLFLVGDIDFEVPTPAVVKEGNLSPYQDLAYLVSPTAKETDFLKNQKELFFNLVKTVSENQSFKIYFFNKVIGRQNQKGIKIPWGEFLNDNLDLAIAAVKYFMSVNTPIPRDIYIIAEMRNPFTIDDWLVLLEDYCLNYLKMSKETGDALLLKETKAGLKTLGVVLCETGFRQYISATERVLSLSDSKNIAVVEILKNEFANLGERLRATIITDFEKSSALSLKSLQGILDPEAGGAVRVLRHLVSEKVTNELDPIMLTGSAILIDADWADKFVSEGQKWLKERKLNATLSIKATDDAKISEIDGEGNDWEPKNYVRFTTSLFEKGITKCLIGTRGLLGEGWDSISLNTLIDLTSAGTFTTVNQIRGRSIRLDPDNKYKVANNWDVVCVAPGIPKGENDFARLVRKHSQFYGLANNKLIVKGIQHVDKSLANAYFAKGIAKLEFMMVNKRALDKARNRSKAYDDWEIGKPYSNFVIHATELKKEDIKFKTAFTFKKSLRRLLYIIAANVAGHFLFLSQFVRPRNIQELWIFYIIAGLIAGGISAKYIYVYFRKAFIDLPVDSYLMDFAKAILETLKKTEMVNAQVSFDNLRVVAMQDGTYQVYLDYAKEKDIKKFSECFRDIMSPITDQRYLVSRNEASLDGNFFSPVWYTIRELTQVFRRETEFYHPVPNIFSQNKRLAFIFSRAWSKYVGGGRLIYTRSNKGRNILLKNRIKNRLQIGLTHLEEWR